MLLPYVVRDANEPVVPASITNEIISSSTVSMG